MDRTFLDVVCDAGPLIHLDELDCLDLLDGFHSILVPDQVWREVQNHRPGALEGSPLQVERVSVALSEVGSFRALVRALALDVGEQEALSLMRLHPDAILLTDDAAARLAADALGYRVPGSIAILLRAIRRGQRTSRDVLSILREVPARSSLHIRPNLLQQINATVERQEAWAGRE
jgi:predicted nucleic acid-binding protein